MHSIITALCTGCDLCVPPCPVDCISMINQNTTAETTDPEATGWNAWSQEQADAARDRHGFREWRLKREKEENTTRLLAKAAVKLSAVQSEMPDNEEQAKEKARKLAVIAAAVARAKQQQHPEKS